MPLWPITESSCRPPHGGRGLKFQGPSGFKSGAQSPPARGAWIEISRLGIAKEHVLESPPARGAWIEIICWYLEELATQGRPPHGGRGLK